MTHVDGQSGWSHEPDADTPERAPGFIVSPCIRRCTLDDDDFCVGCGRMLAEILEWAAAPAVRKLAIRAAAAKRLEQRRRPR